MGDLIPFPGERRSGPNAREEPVDVGIGRRLRMWREQRSVTLESLSQACGMTVEALQSAERGTVRLRASDVHVITQTLHLPIWALFGEREYR